MNAVAVDEVDEDEDVDGDMGIWMWMGMGMWMWMGMWMRKSEVLVVRQLLRVSSSQAITISYRLLSLRENML